MIKRTCFLNLVGATCLIVTFLMAAGNFGMLQEKNLQASQSIQPQGDKSSGILKNKHCSLFKIFSFWYQACQKIKQYASFQVWFQVSGYYSTLEYLISYQLNYVEYKTLLIIMGYKFSWYKCDLCNIFVDKNKILLKHTKKI